MPSVLISHPYSFWIIHPEHTDHTQVKQTNKNKLPPNIYNGFFCSRPLSLRTNVIRRRISSSRPLSLITWEKLRRQSSSFSMQKINFALRMQIKTCCQLGSRPLSLRTNAFGCGCFVFEAPFTPYLCKKTPPLLAEINCKNQFNTHAEP